MQVIIDQDISLAEDVRLIKRLYKVEKDATFPEGLKFAYQYLGFKDNDWIEVCRVDNYKHDKRKTGAHAHKLGKEEVEFKDMTFEEAEEYIISLGGWLKRDL